MEKEIKPNNMTGMIVKLINLLTVEHKEQKFAQAT